MQISDELIKVMGFEEHDPPLKVMCKFYSLKVYCIQGVYFDTEVEYIDRLSTHSLFGIGKDINALCIKMTNDNYSDELETWMKEKNARAPFLMTLTSNNIDYTENCKWVQRHAGQLLTYDCFSKAKADLDEFVYEREVPYLPLITAVLTSNNHLVKLKHVDTSKYGQTPEGQCLLDITSRAHIDVNTSSRISIEKAFIDITGKLKTYSSPEERFSRLMYNSMQETDNIKSFLFAWTALEVFINKQFSKLSVIDFPREHIPDKYKDRINKLYSQPNRGRKISTVAQKYAYLSIFTWSFLDIDDYDTFINAKDMRDSFIHGDKINVGALPTRQVLLILNKIIANMAAG